MELNLVLNKDNYFMHVGSDPVDNVVKFNNKWNLENQPSIYHKYNKAKKDFVLDTKKQAQAENPGLIKEKEKQLDIIMTHYARNELFYKDTSNYQSTKDDLIAQRKKLILDINQLRNAIK